MADATRKRILVVDDDLMAAAAIKHPLTKAGYTVETAADGAAALEWVRCEIPDLIILDVVMPGLSGYDVCRRLRQDPATQAVPVVFLSARHDVQHVLEGRQAGSDLYLTKPVLASRLLETVDMFLGPSPSPRRRDSPP